MLKKDSTRQSPHLNIVLLLNSFIQSRTTTLFILALPAHRQSLAPYFLILLHTLTLEPGYIPTNKSFTLSILLRESLGLSKKKFSSLQVPWPTQCQFSVHSSERVFQIELCDIFWRNLFALYFDAFGEFLHLFDFAGVSTLVEVFGFFETCVISFEALIMFEIDAVGDLIVADVEAVCKLEWVCDGSYGCYTYKQNSYDQECAVQIHDYIIRLNQIVMMFKVVLECSLQHSQCNNIMIPALTDPLSLSASQILNKTTAKRIQYQMNYHTDVQHALLQFASTFHPTTHTLTLIKQFSDGLVFAHMLATVELFPLRQGELERQCPRWIQRLTNLKKIVQKIEAYVGDGGKQVRTKDIDLIEIAKHDSSEHIQRLFELVIAVFMQSPHKEDYIQTIMRLDERSQHALVVIVQNAIDQRLAQSSEGLSHNKTLEHLQELTNENELLREELQEAQSAAEKYKREAIDYRDRWQQIQEGQQKQRKLVLQSGNEQSRQEIQKLKGMNDNLKQKLLHVIREHQQQLGKGREQNIFLQNKMVRYKEYEEAVDQLKEQLAEAHNERERTSDHDRERRRLNRVIEEKEAIIARFKQMVEDVNQKNVNMQQTEFSMKMQLERKEFRFKQLQSQVKNRLKADHFPSNTPLLPAQTTTVDAQQLDYLQQQVQKLRASGRELDRQNLKLKKKLQKSQLLQGEKKKLQKIILDVSKSKEVEIEMLLVSLYELRGQNIRMHAMLRKQ